MARLILIDNERRTYPPASAHRERNIRWDHVAVWSVLAVIGLLSMIGTIRVVILLYHAVTLDWLR